MILPDRNLDEDVDARSDEHPRVPGLVRGEEGEHSGSDRDRDGVVNKGGHHHWIYAPARLPSRKASV